LIVFFNSEDDTSCVVSFVEGLDGLITLGDIALLIEAPGILVTPGISTIFKENYQEN
jgi:hypothetical protein